MISNNLIIPLYVGVLGTVLDALNRSATSPSLPHRTGREQLRSVCRIAKYASAYYPSTVSKCLRVNNGGLRIYVLDYINYSLRMHYATSGIVIYINSTHELYFDRARSPSLLSKYCYETKYCCFYNCKSDLFIIFISNEKYICAIINNM